MEKKMEMYYQIRINLQLAIQKPFRESLQGTRFLKENSDSIVGILQKRCSLMVCKILRKKLALESLYICRLSSKVTPALLFLSEFCRVFKDTYLVENLRTVTSDRGSFSRSVWGNSKSTFAQDSRVLTCPPPPCFRLYVFEHPSPPSNRKVIRFGQNSPSLLQFLYMRSLEQRN